MAGPGDLWELLAEFRDAVKAGVSTSPGGAITRAYVSPGAPSVDCLPMLAVHAGGPAEADTAPLAPPLQPGHRAMQTGTVHLVQMTATVLRCAPAFGGEDGSEPVVADLEAAAKETLGDVWAIWHSLRAAYRAGTLFASPSGSREFFFDPAVALNIQGGAAGWAIPCRVQLPGY